MYLGLIQGHALNCNHAEAELFKSIMYIVNHLHQMLIGAESFVNVEYKIYIGLKSKFDIHIFLFNISDICC